MAGTTVTIRYPGPNQTVLIGDLTVEVGWASSGAEPHSIDAVTVALDNQTPVLAESFPPTHIFRATVNVASGNHLVTVVATQDDGKLITKAVAFQAKAELPPPPVLDPGPPAVLLEIGANIPANDPIISTFVNLLRLGPLSEKLAAAGFGLFGPSFQNARGVLRIGLWIKESWFPFTDAAAALGFGDAPLLLSGGGGGVGFPFGLSIPVATLNQLVAILLPALRDQVSTKTGGQVTLDSVSVVCTPPNAVTTTIAMHGGVPSASATATIDELIGTAPATDRCTGGPVTYPGTAGTTVPAMAPTITASFTSTSVDVLAQVVLGVLVPFVGWAFLAEAAAIAIFVPDVVAQQGAQATFTAAGILANMPTSVPFKSLTSLQSDFPKVVFNWSRFFTTAAGIRAYGFFFGAVRDTACIKLIAPIRFGDPSQLAGGATASVFAIWSDILPDPDKFKWNVVPGGSVTDYGAIDPQSQAGAFVANLPLPAPLAPGSYGFTITVTATETGVRDTNARLSASASTSLVVVAGGRPPK